MQKWVYDKGWTSLHDAQERAIGPILDGNRDVIISAATAAGKTEAAFLPICSALIGHDDNGADQGVDSPPSHGVETLYISPLKALINDQYERLEMLCERAHIPVHRWHGDVSSSAKHKVLRAPSGVLLITPESLEAIFVNRGTQAPALFAGLRYVVLDELHSFLSTPRGAQLQSLLHRIEVAIRRRPPRIGLSATLGDMAAGARFIRPDNPSQVLLINSTADGQELRLQVRGYRATAPVLSEKAARVIEESGGTVKVEDTETGDRLAIAEHLFSSLRGSDNLIFANARRDVELYADLLSRRCEAHGVPNEFWPHHGSLAKDVREIVEAQLKDRSRPVSAVCTSTLEMGIDIGSVASVAQIGPPASVAAFRQRLGRSGRRDGPATIRVYVSEEDVDVRSTLVDQLRCSLIQTVAMVRLLLSRWIEPPVDPGMNISTLIQQVLSIIAQHGGALAVDLHRTLCGPGPFELVDKVRFSRLLRAMAVADLITQAGDGTLLHGLAGERFVNHYSFYTAFQTPEEWRLVAEGRTLGSLPIYQPLVEGGLIIFAGRRWRVTSIDSGARVIELRKAAAGLVPHFGGSVGLIGDLPRAEMVKVFQETEIPAWLDQEGKSLLLEGRQTWKRHNLEDHVLVESGASSVVLPWRSDQALTTVSLILSSVGIESSIEGPSIVVTDQSLPQLMSIAAQILEQPQPDAVDVARELKNTEIDKWDWVLDEELATEAAAARLLDVSGAWRILQDVATNTRTKNDHSPSES